MHIVSGKFVKKSKKETVIKILEVFLVMLTLMSFLKAIWISLDIDEAYAVTLGYRMARGDKLVRDMWEPHQFSGFLAAFFTIPFLRINGNTEYLIIYLRIIGILIHVILGLVLYCQLKKNINHFSAFIIMILHLNFLPKWVQLPEFELMHYWCLLGIFLVLYAYFLKGNLVARHWYIKARMLLPFLGGCLLVCSMFCYPTMIFLYPFYILALYVLERHYNKIRGSKVWRSSISFTVGAFLTGFLFVIHLFSYMSLDELKRYISYIFMDTSHNLYTMGEKWAIYLEQIQGQTKEYSVYILVGAGIMLVFFLFGKLIFGKRISFHMHTDILHIAVTVLLITGFLMQVTAVYGFLFEDKNQFFLQTRYIAILLPAVLLGMYNYKKMTIWLWLCVVPGIMSVPAVLFVTNMDTNITYAKAFLGVLGSFLIFEQYWREIPKNSIWRKI